MYRYFKSLTEDYILRINVSEPDFNTNLEIHYSNSKTNWCLITTGGTDWNPIATANTLDLLESVLEFNTEIEITQEEVYALMMVMELKK